jgi:hypothetical protein
MIPFRQANNRVQARYGPFLRSLVRWVENAEWQKYRVSGLTQNGRLPGSPAQT